MKRFFTLSIILFYASLFLFSRDLTEDELVGRIAKILIEEYDNYKDKSFIEKTVLKLGKPAFIDSVKNWTKHYKNLEEMEIKLPLQIENILKISKKYLNEDENMEFRNNFEELTFLGYKNLQIYYEALKDYLSKNDNKDISIKILDEALTDIKYFEQKKSLYEKEFEIKEKIRDFFKNKKIKYRLSFYSFAFDFLDGIRVKIIKKDMETMLKKIKEGES
ncbi:MAG TPA: hypothetical protein PLO89_04295 [Spirochaetota bacterium]|nr:hypothetical protein [Spirochaetota bacterium]